MKNEKEESIEPFDCDNCLEQDYDANTHETWCMLEECKYLKK